MIARARALLCFVAVSLLSGCPDGVGLVPLYETEIDLCAADRVDELASRVEACRAAHELDGSCAGVMSFAGTLFGEGLVVDTELVETEEDHAVFADDSSAFDVLTLYGDSPYFAFKFALSLIGGAPDLGDTSRVLEIGGPTGNDPGWSTDAFARAEVRISAPPDSVDLAMTRGQLVITYQTAGEHAGTFSFARGADTLTGCFHAFSTTSRTRTEASP